MMEAAESSAITVATGAAGWAAGLLLRIDDVLGVPADAAVDADEPPGVEAEATADEGAGRFLKWEIVHSSPT